jgi:indole-3-glycerol phosphate synthase
MLLRVVSLTCNNYVKGTSERTHTLRRSPNIIAVNNHGVYRMEVGKKCLEELREFMKERELLEGVSVDG